MEKDKYVYGRGGKTEKKKEENIWKRKAYFWLRRRKRRKIFGEGKYLFLWRRGKMEKEKGGNIWRKEMNGDANQPTNRVNNIQGGVKNIKVGICKRLVHPDYYLQEAGRS